MILATSLKSLFNSSHRQAIIDLVYNEQVKNANLAKTTFAYLDKKGRKYRRYENEGELPLERYAQLMEFMQYIAKGLTAQEDEKLDNEIESALEDGLKDERKKATVRIGALLHERKLRRKMCIHSQLIWNYLAVQWIREDEQPDVYDPEIQMDKVNTLMEENQTGAVDFFFQQHELKRLRDLLNMSKEDWQLSMNEFQVQTKRLQELLLLTASKKLSNGQEKTSGK